MRAISSSLFLSSSVVAFLAVACLPVPVLAQELECAQPVVVDSAPPPLPDYDQPPVPGPDYLWTPGYWAWSDDEDDYYWVPGTWVLPPREGLLWTPGYWAWAGGSYLFHPGYWGDEVGYYGGVDYGYGYGADGYDGGHWEQGHFIYNRELRRPHSFISFNGGTDGTQAHPTPQQRAFARLQHFAPTALQTQNASAASKDKTFFSKNNGGKPTVGATSKPGVFSGAVKPLKTLAPEQPSGAGNPNAGTGVEQHEFTPHPGTSGTLPPHPSTSGTLHPLATSGTGQHPLKLKHLQTGSNPTKPKIVTHPHLSTSSGPTPHPLAHPTPHPALRSAGPPHPTPHPITTSNPTPHRTVVPHPVPHPTAAPHPAPHPQKKPPPPQ